MKDKGKILILDSDRSFREGFRDILQYYFGDYTVEVASSLDHVNRLDIPKMIISEPIQCAEYFSYIKQKGAKIIFFMLEVSKISYNDIESDIDGFLSKNMETETIIKIIEDILYHDSVYVYPYFGYQFYQELIKQRIN